MTKPPVARKLAVGQLVFWLLVQGFSLASAIGHSPKIVPVVRDFAVQFGQFVRDNFRKRCMVMHSDAIVFLL